MLVSLYAGTNHKTGLPMFASIHANLILSVATMAGCCVSKPFAASVVAGAVGVFIACVVIYLNRNSHRSTVL